MRCVLCVVLLSPGKTSVPKGSVETAERGKRNGSERMIWSEEGDNLHETERESRTQAGVASASYRWGYPVWKKAC